MKNDSTFRQISSPSYDDGKKLDVRLHQAFNVHSLTSITILVNNFDKLTSSEIAIFSSVVWMFS